MRFTCSQCGMTFAHPDDAREGYCGNCHDWTRGMRMPFQRLVAEVSQLSEQDQKLTFGDLSERWGEPAERIMDAAEALKLLREATLAGISVGTDYAAVFRVPGTHQN